MEKQHSKIELYLLGVPHFARRGEVISLTNAKAKALLAYLALKQLPQSREHIAYLLWAESSDDAARKNLRNVLWAIRNAFGDEIFAVDDDEQQLSLGSDVWVDALAFDAISDIRQATTYWRQTIKLYRGTLLEELYLRDAPEFERWLTIERERLETAYFEGIKILLNVYQTERQWETLIDLARDALRYNPLQEEIHRALMEAYGRLGKRVQAIQQYETLRHILQNELDIQPLEETRTLFELIAAGKLDELPIGANKRQTTGESRYRNHDQLPFVGREDALQQLDTVLASAHKQRPQVVLISGEMGIGKSRLWWEWIEKHHPELNVLAAQSLSSTRSMPFFPLIEVFRTDLCVRRLFSPGSPVPAVWLTEIARLMPDIQYTLRNLPEAPPILSHEEDRLRIFQAFAQSLIALEQHPLVLFFDDVHWADHATLEWIEYLTHRFQHEAVMIVMTYRLAEATHLTKTLSHLRRNTTVTQIDLNALTLEDANSLLESQVTQHAAISEIHEKSAGNPYYMLELSASSDVLFSPLADLTRERFSQLRDIEQHILQTSVVVSPMITYSLLKSVSGRSEDELLNALEGLMQRNILKETERGYQFVHPFLAEVIYDNLSSARRQVLHRRAADEIKKLYVTELPQLAPQLALHYAEAKQMTQAAHYAETAGDVAMNLVALVEAQRFYKDSLDWEASSQRWWKLGRVQQLRGHLDDAITSFDQAIEADDLDTDSVIHTKLLRTEVLLQSGNIAEAQRDAQTIAQDIEATDKPELQTRAMLLLASIRLRAGSALQEVRKHFEAALAVAGNHQPGAEIAHARFEIGNVMAQTGDLQGAMDILNEAAHTSDSNDLYMTVLAHNNRAYYAILANQLDVADADLQTAFEIVKKHELQLPLQYLYSTRGELALAQQALDEAQEWFTRGLEEAQLHGNKLQAANYLANMSLVAYARDDYEQSQQLLDDAEARIGELDAPFLKHQIQLWRAELAMKMGDMQQVKRLIQDLQKRLNPDNDGLLLSRLERLQVNLSESL